MLVLIWNLESNETDWNKDIRKHYQQHDRGTPQYYKGWWRKCFEVEAYAELFEKPEEKSSPWKVGMTEDQVSSAAKLLRSFHLLALPLALFPLCVSSLPAPISPCHITAPYPLPHSSGLCYVVVAACRFETPHHWYYAIDVKTKLFERQKRRIYGQAIDGGRIPAQLLAALTLARRPTAL